MNYWLQLICSYNKMIFIRYNLEAVSFKFDEDDDLNIQYNNISQIDQELIKEMIEIDYPAGISAGEIRNRLNQGNLLYTARNEEGLIGYGWVAVDSCYIPYLDSKINLAPNEFYTYGMSVKKNFRGQGIMNRYRKFVNGNLKEKGYSIVITSYMYWNKSVERANTKMGFHYIGEVIYGYIFLFRYFLNKMPKGKIQHQDNFLGKWKKLFSKK